MANNLQYTINFISPFCRYMSPNVGINNMPIIGIANIVRNVILAAPLTWRFNRNTVNLVGSVGSPPAGIQQGVQDYTQSFTDFGFLETATASDGKTSWQFKDIYNTETLGLSVVSGSDQGQARPMSISVYNDDGAGNITFRLSAVPDQSYSVNLIYQRAPTSFISVTDPWAPIPDAFSDIYNNLCLGYYMDSAQDPRAQQYISRGIAGLLARAEGLSEMDKLLFAQAYMNFNAQMMSEQLKTQQGRTAQGAR
jgi:hypothetical protein